jgi:hypothetical protein
VNVGNEPSGFIKGGKFTDMLSDYQLLKKIVKCPNIKGHRHNVFAYRLNNQRERTRKSEETEKFVERAFVQTLMIMMMAV